MRTLLSCLLLATLAASRPGPLAGEAPADFQAIQTPPAPRDGMEELARLVRYPDSAKKDGLEGKVAVQVDIDALGKVTRTLILRPVRADLDSAAVQAVRACVWTPARSSTGATASQVVVPIMFRLEAKP